MEHAIETTDLLKRYRGTNVVDRVNLSVPLGSVYCLLGRNGSGKTTTIRTLLGLAKADEGAARVLGFDTAQERERTQVLARTGFVCDKPLPQTMTGAEIIRMNRGFYPRWSDELSKRYIDLFELPLKTQFRNLSRGSQTKLWLLLAFAQQPDLLILDEPTAGLDPVATEEFLRLLIEDFTNNGHSVFLSSHHISEIEKIADWVGIFDHGQLLIQARAEDLRADFRRLQVVGTGLPRDIVKQILRTRVSSGTTEYVLSGGAEEFVASLKRQGARVLQCSPMNLSEVFLEFVGKEL